MIDEKAIVKAAVDTWGLNMQKIICMEECGELIHALAKSMRPSREDNLEMKVFDLRNIAEEIANVELCIAQMKIAMPDIVSDIEQIKAEYLDRLKSRTSKSHIICHEERVNGNDNMEV